MNQYKEQLEKCLHVIDRIRNMINIQQLPSNMISYNELYDVLYYLVPLIPEEFHIFRDRLRDKVLPNLKIPDYISIDKQGRRISTPENGINPYSFGEVIATITYLDKFYNNSDSSFWDNIHPQIISVSKSRFYDGYFADAVEAAFKEVNSRVKNIYKERTSIEKDGAKLMQAAFSAQNPIVKLDDTSTETGMNVQLGYMEMFAGAMKGIRNPKAHCNQTISKSEAIRKLHFASMLMYKLDNEII